MDPVFRVLDSVINALPAILLINSGGIIITVLTATKVIQDRTFWSKRTWLAALIAASINLVYLVPKIGESTYPKNWWDMALHLIIVVGIALVTAVLGRWELRRKSTVALLVVGLGIANIIMFFIALILGYMIYGECCL